MEAEIREIIQKELPRAIAEEPGMRDFVLRTVSEYYTPRNEFDQKFDRVLDELQRDREEQARKWDEQNLNGMNKTANGMRIPSVWIGWRHKIVQL